MSTNRTTSDGTSGVPLIPLWVRIMVAIAAISGLLYFSVVPAPGVGSVAYGPLGVIPYSMWLHFLGYMGLAIALGYASYSLPSPDRHLWAFIMAFGFGTAVEFLQYTVPTRTFSTADMAVNGVGAAVGILLLGAVDWLARFYQDSKRSEAQL